MKKYFYILNFIFTIITFVLQSCGNKKQNNVQVENSEKPASILAVENRNKDKKNTYLKNTFVFNSYDDNGDYTLLNAQNGNDSYSFINDKNDDRSLLRGDICEIEWEKDTIYIAGDGETPEIADWLVSIKKIKDGNVSKFRKAYKKELKYHWSEEKKYSKNYLDEIYLLVEYYIANSKNELIKHSIKTKEQLEYSIEERFENNRHYEMLGIGYTFDHRFSIMQWIYIDRETKQIYEYDLSNERLIAFD